MRSTILLFAIACGASTVPAAEIGVRIRFGINDKSTTIWDGTVAVSPGKVTHIDGWRFQQRDEVLGVNGWKASTRALTVRRSNNPKKAGGGANSKAASPRADNGLILLLEEVNENSILKVKTEQGNFEVKLSEIPYGAIVEKLEGSVEVERVAASRQLSTARTDDDFPAIAVNAKGDTFVVYQSFSPGLDRDGARSFTKEPSDLSFLAKPPGGDQLWLRVQEQGKWAEPVAVTAGKGDIYKSAMAIDGKGAVWIFWSEQQKDNFDIWARSYQTGQLGKAERISTDAGSDVSPVAATDSKGRVWVAWQGAREGVFCILERHQTEPGWSEETRVSTQKGSCWQPALAAAKDGRVAVLWDTYDRGDYDVWLREFDAQGKSSEARPAANTDQYEARPSAAYDQQGNLWISWEHSGQTWGKDWGALVHNSGIGLYRDRQIRMTVLTKDGFKEPADSFVSALPSARPRRGVRNLPVRRPEPEISTRKVGQEADTSANTYNNLARLVCDRDNRIWLFARAREGNFHTTLGSVWMNYAAYFDGKKWVGPILLPHSDNLLYNLPAVAAHPQGGLIVAHSSDHRQDRHVTRGGGNNNSALEGENDPFVNDVFVSRLEFSGSAVTPRLKRAAVQPNPNAQPTAAMLKEREDVAHVRNYRATIDGKELRILRGEFHRHTEISGDGGNDGPLEDMWRYAIDAAAMDWIGCGDHDNGGGREYPWWLTQKTTDAFHIPQHFDPVFSYERSVRYPEGHRNVVFPYRGVRPLPRLPITTREFQGHAPDTQMLYKYLRVFDGVCASHSSTTGMGTDWRDNDPAFEPMVEIYQGCRQNYERPGAPRCPTADDAIGGWEPLGFINLALLKGYRFAFESSSDHTSTHISYCLVYAEKPTRQSIVNGMKVRHTYGATDNILADFRCTADGVEHMMGDEFASSSVPVLRCKLGGTAAFKKVVLVKDDVEEPIACLNQRDMDFSWTDPKPVAGKTSYYYVRGEQVDGELVWASPMWIKYQPK